MKEVSDEWVRELNAQLLAGWWCLTLGALEETAGPEKASQLIRPHMEHSAYAGYLEMKKRMGWNGDDSMATLFKMIGTGHLLLRKPVKRIRVRGEAEGSIEFDECPFSGASKLTCVTLCYHVIRGIAAGANPNFSGDLPKTMMNGDECCVKGIKNNDRSIYDSKAPWIDITIDLSSLSQEERDYYFCSYLGQFFINAIKAFNDFSDEKGTFQLLAPRFIEYGREIGSQIVEELSLSKDIIGLTRVVELIDRALYHEQTKWTSINEVQMEIRSCPFSGAFHPTCALIESFFNGICEVIDPDFIFVYDHMMTRGDKLCHWTIKNRFVSTDTLKQNVVEEDAFKVLRMRFAKGEITAAQYREMKKELSE